MNHSELPWKVIKMEGSNDLYILTKNKKGWNEYILAGIIPNLDAKANASFIVRACNNHEKLVEACKEAKSIISGLLGDKRYTGGYEDEVCDKLEQAIQSAEEGK